MRTQHFLLLALFAVFVTVGCSGADAPSAPAPPPPPPPAVGNWSMSIETPMGTQTPTLMISGDASALSGTMASEQGDTALEDVAFADGTLTFTMNINAGGQDLALTFSGTVEGDSINGAFGSDFGDMAATATRKTE